MGRGIIYGAAHGPLPNPAPATLGIICKAKIPTFGTEEDRELVTPSGAAILAALCHSHGYVITRGGGLPVLPHFAFYYYTYAHIQIECRRLASIYIHLAMRLV